MNGAPGWMTRRLRRLALRAGAAGRTVRLRFHARGALSNLYIEPQPDVIDSDGTLLSGASAWEPREAMLSLPEDLNLDWILARALAWMPFPLALRRCPSCRQPAPAPVSLPEATNVPMLETGAICKTDRLTKPQPAMEEINASREGNVGHAPFKERKG